MQTLEHGVGASRWLLPASLVGSAAVGALVTLYVVRSPTPAQVGAQDVHAATLRALEASVSSLATRIEELERTQRVLALSRPSFGGGDAVAAPPTDRRAVEPVRADRESERAFPSNWMDALDERVATALVERALTPFDPGVAEPVRAAGVALRVAADEHARAWMRLNARFPSGVPGDVTTRAEMETMRARLAEARDAAIRELEAQLDALLK